MKQGRLRKSRKAATRKIKEKKAAGFCVIQRMQLFISAGFASSGRVILFLKALGSLLGGYSHSTVAGGLPVMS